MARILIGSKIRDRRRALGTTQLALARQLGISASYLNLIESNRRNIGGALLKHVADCLAVDLDEFDGAAERRLVDDLVEVASSTVLGVQRPPASSAADLAAQHPAWARALVGLHRGCLDREHAVAALSDRLNQDPFLGDAVHSLLSKVTAIRSACEILESDANLETVQRERFLAIVGNDSRRLADVASALANFFDKARTTARSVTPLEEVDDFIAEHDNHFPRLEAAAGMLRGALGEGAIEPALVAWLKQMHGVRVERFSTDDPTQAADATRLDAAAGRLRLPDTVSGSTRRFELARCAAELGCADTVNAELDTAPRGLTPAARRRTERALTAYVAGAVLLPYESFFAATLAARYDINLLTRKFGASFEQVCHRLATLRRPGAAGIRFGFVRADPAGHLTKRFPLPELAWPRYGNACPLWTVYKAFQAPGVLERQLVEFPNGTRYLFLARAVEKSRVAYQAPRRLMSIMLACNVLHADRLIYADGLDLSSAAPALPVGQACRLCVRRDCTSREEDPIIDAGTD